MIKKLQRKFIFITISSLFIVLLIVVGTINAINIIQTENKTNELINIILDHDGVLPRDFKGPKIKPKDDFNKMDSPFRFEYSKETPFQTRYFSIKFFDNGDTVIDIKNIASIDYLEASDLAELVINSGKTSGYKGIYKFKISEKDGYKLLVFLDCRKDILVIRDFAIVSIFVGILFLILVLILLSILSKRAIKPFIESMEKQKRFITDAGHEIKTPLAIISANTEVIEMYNGENEWTQSIRNQVNRLSELIKSLLSLAKMDENDFNLEMEEFSCGDVVCNLVDNFDALFNNKNLDLQKNIDSSLKMVGNRNDFYNLISILLDNSVKYTPDGGKIEIFFGKKDNKVEFSILNTCEEFLQGDLRYLFDRFYRLDNSRSREGGGYGIGLSIAESIVKAHKGKITAIGKGNEVCFRFLLPQNLDKRK